MTTLWVNYRLALGLKHRVAEALSRCLNHGGPIAHPKISHFLGGKAADYLEKALLRVAGLTEVPYIL